MDNADLSNFFRTKSEANDFVIRLSQITEEVYQTDFNLEKSLTYHFGLDKKDKFIVFLRENNINLASSSEIKEFFDKLQGKISKLPVLSLTLAFEPKEETLNLINEWFTLNIKKQFVFDITLNPHIIAGITLNFNGRYLDYSIKPKFDKILKDVLEDEAKNHPLPVKHQITN